MFNVPQLDRQDMSERCGRIYHDLSRAFGRHIISWNSWYIPSRCTRF